MSCAVQVSRLDIIGQINLGRVWFVHPASLVVLNHLFASLLALSWLLYLDGFASCGKD